MSTSTGSTWDRNYCPRCGSALYRWRESDSADPGDVEQHAECTNASCDWGF